MVALYHILLQVLCIIGDKKKNLFARKRTLFNSLSVIMLKKNSASDFMRPRVMPIYCPICGFLRRRPKLKSVVNMATAHAEILR